MAVLCGVRYWASVCCYSVCGTGLAYGGGAAHEGTAVCGTPYAVCGTELAYAPTRCAVERLTGKLRDQRKELEALEKQHVTEKDRMAKDMDKLK
eukprot:1888738-Rhodomonas_salina.3